MSAHQHHVVEATVRKPNAWIRIRSVEHAGIPSRRRLVIRGPAAVHLHVKQRGQLSRGSRLKSLLQDSLEGFPVTSEFLRDIIGNGLVRHGPGFLVPRRRVRES